MEFVVVICFGWQLEANEDPSRGMDEQKDKPTHGPPGRYIYIAHLGRLGDTHDVNLSWRVS